MASRAGVEWMYGQLQKDLWEEMGPQKVLAGRKLTNRAIAAVVRQWPGASAWGEASREDSQSDLKRGVMANLRDEGGRRYGFFWTLILSALISQIIRLLLDWWLDHDDNKAALALMQTMKQEDSNT